MKDAKNHVWRNHRTDLYLPSSCVMLHDPDNAESPIRVMELVSLITASWCRAGWGRVGPGKGVRHHEAVWGGACYIWPYYSHTNYFFGSCIPHISLNLGSMPLCSGSSSSLIFNVSRLPAALEQSSNILASERYKVWRIIPLP